MRYYVMLRGGGFEIVRADDFAVSASKQFIEFISADKATIAFFCVDAIIGFYVMEEPSEGIGVRSLPINDDDD